MTPANTKPCLLTPEVRALLNAFGAQHEDHDSEISNMLAELAAVQATHPEAIQLHVNSDNAWNYKRGIFVFQFGAYACTHVLAFGNLDDALEDAAATLKEVAPGHFCDDVVNESYTEAYNDAIARGLDEDDAREAAQATADEDVTYTESGYLTAYEWTVVELRSRASVARYIVRGE